MFKLDGSEISWLVYADWLEDKGISANHIREFTNNPTTNQFHFEYSCMSYACTCTVDKFSAVGSYGGGEGEKVGTNRLYNVEYSLCEMQVGTADWMGDNVGTITLDSII